MRDRKHRATIQELKQKAISSLPINDSSVVSAAKTYLGMSDEALSKLPEFHPDGSIYFYNVGDAVFGKLTLIQFIKSIKNK